MTQNILFIIDHLRADGTQQMLLKLIVELRKKNINSEIYCLNDSLDQSFLLKLENTGALVKIIGKKKLLCGLGVIELYQRLQVQKITGNLIVTFLFWSDILAWLLSEIIGATNRIIAIRANNRQFNFVQRFLHEIAMKRTRRVLFNAQSILADMAKRYPGEKEKYYYVPNFLNHAEPVNITKNKSSESIHTLVSVGRLTYQKGFDILIQALSLVETKIRLIIIGEGELRKQLQELIRKQNFSHDILFTGKVDDISNYLLEADIYIQSSRFEGTPNALMEAMSMGCACIGSEVDGNCELIKHEVNGLLVPSEDLSALASAILTLVGSRELRLRYGLAARSSVMEKYSPSTGIDIWLKALSLGQESFF